jgi:NAD-dependent dihydropyrimidine dehydrogenase PreA subunit
MTLFRWISLTPRGLAPAAIEPSTPPPVAAPQRKWLPVIDTDACIGCERCVAACEHGCLEMIWSFSTLTHPHQCHGEGHCVEACPEQIIRMEWVLVDADSEAGQASQAAR